MQHDKYDNDILRQLTKIAKSLEKIANSLEKPVEPIKNCATCASFHDCQYWWKEEDHVGCDMWEGK